MHFRILNVSMALFGFIAMAPLAHADIIVDVVNTDTPIATASLSDFQAFDATLSAGSAVSTVTGIAGFGAINLTDDVVSLTTTNSGTFFTEGDATGTGAFTDAAPIFDESIFVRSNRTGYDPNALPTLNFTGLAALDIGQAVTLTLYGAGGVAPEQATFISTFAGTSTPLTTNFANGATIGGGVVQQTFTADGINDTLSVTIDRDAAGDVRGFLNGFSLSNGVVASTVPEPGSLALLGLAGMAVLGRRRRRA